MFVGIKVNENSRKQYSKKLMLLCGDVDILSFVIISRLNWIGHVNRMDSKRKVRYLTGKSTKRRTKNRWNCVQTDINKCKVLHQTVEPLNKEGGGELALNWKSAVHRFK
jgi:hypothetical protein